jgi:hypothetical protein
VFLVAPVWADCSLSVEFSARTIEQQDQTLSAHVTICKTFSAYVTSAIMLLRKPVWFGDVGVMWFVDTCLCLWRGKLGTLIL